MPMGPVGKHREGHVVCCAGRCDSFASTLLCRLRWAGAVTRELALLFCACFKVTKRLCLSLH